MANQKVETLQANGRSSLPDWGHRGLPGLNGCKLNSICPRGTILFSEGQPSETVYLLNAGRVRVSISSSSGRTVFLRIGQPGNLLGMNAALNGTVYDTTVQALETCRVEFVSRLDLLKMIDKDPSVGAAIARAVSLELSEIVSRARLLTLSESALEKLVRLLLDWCRTGKVTPEGIRVDGLLKQEEIAQMICSSRETVTRHLARLKREGLIAVRDNVILVRDIGRLEVLAGASEQRTHCA